MEVTKIFKQIEVVRLAQVFRLNATEVAIKNFGHGVY